MVYENPHGESGDSDSESTSSLKSNSNSSEKLNASLSSSSSSPSSPSTSPKLLSTRRCNSMFESVRPHPPDEELRIQMPVTISVPRTVPCIVLSPNNEVNKQLIYTRGTNQIFPIPITSPLDSIMTKISKLSNSNPPLFRESGTAIWETSERYHEDNLRESMELYDSMKQLVRDSQIRIDGSNKEISNGRQENSSKEETNSSKLSFGMDRILANAKSDSEKQDEPNRPFLPILSKTHQDFHPRYVNHCSECYLFSRFCYKYTLPRSSPASGLCQSSPNCSSWNTTPHFYEPNSPILLPSSNGYGHTSLAAYPQTNSANYTGISSIVSCNTNGNSRRKRSWSRAVFSNLQRKGLEKRFQIQKYITKPDRRQLAATLGLTDAQVKVWFQNRRMKWRHTKEGKSGDIVVGTNLNATPISSSNTSAAPPRPTSSQEKK